MCVGKKITLSEVEVWDKLKLTIFPCASLQASPTRNHLRGARTKKKLLGPDLDAREIAFFCRSLSNAPLPLTFCPNFQWENFRLSYYRAISPAKRKFLFNRKTTNEGVGDPGYPWRIERSQHKGRYDSESIDVCLRHGHGSLRTSQTLRGPCLARICQEPSS